LHHDKGSKRKPHKQFKVLRMMGTNDGNCFANIDALLLDVMFVW
jgi:hypothetical protein